LPNFQSAKVFDKFLGGLPGAGRLERQHGKMRHALARKEEFFVARIRQTKWRLGALEEHHGVRLEGHHHRRSPRLPRIGLRFLDQGLMPAVHTVENADGQIDRAAERSQVRQVMEHLHG
jgi:hypothetical protein